MNYLCFYSLKYAIHTEFQRKNYNQEAQLAIKTRLESLRKGPPKYGIGEDGATPGYVRHYVRQ